MTSKAGFSGHRLGFQRSSIKELMGLGWGAEPSVLNYSECMRPEAGWHRGSQALPAWSSWLPFLSRLVSCLPTTPDSESLVHLSCPSHLRVWEAEAHVLETHVSDGKQKKWGISGPILQSQSLRRDSCASDLSVGTSQEQGERGEQGGQRG